SFDDIFLAYSGEIVRGPEFRDEISLLRELIHDDAIAKRIGVEGFEQAIRKSVRPALLKRFEHRLSVWERVTTTHHKALLRLNGPNELLGFQLGQTLAQHYIENSEYLDVSRSPTVAAFFANHPITGRAPNGETGIIYRFVAPNDAQPPRFDYYSAPACV